MRPTNRPLTTVAIMLALFMAATEATVIATAMPTVVSELGGLHLYGWVGAAYMLASTVTIPLYGKLSDLYGRKPMLFAGLAIFLVGSVLSGAARSMTQLVVFRALQGAGAGGIQPVALTIIGDIFTPQERGRIQGLFGAVWGVAGMAGPLLGGLLVKTLSWRWVFYVNVPFGVLCALVLAVAFEETPARQRRSIDFLGMATLSTSIVALLLGASRTWPAIMLPVAGASLVVFVLVEGRAKEPVLPIALLRRRLIAVSSIGGALIGAVMTGSIVYLPLFVQALLGASPTQAGGTITPMLLGWPIASALSGRLLPKLGYRPLVRGGFALVALAAFATYAAVRADAGATPIAACMACLGIGMGTANTALLIAVQESVAWSERGVATASAMFFRNIGGTVAVGALGALLTARFGPEVPRSLLNDLVGPEHGRNLPADMLALLAGGLRGGLIDIFAVLGVLAGLAFATSLFFPSRKVGDAAREPVIAE
jgi:EmrB/QacA subfamily drug resistance transporter